MGIQLPAFASITVQDMDRTSPFVPIVEGLWRALVANSHYHYAREPRVVIADSFATNTITPGGTRLDCCEYRVRTTPQGSMLIVLVRMNVDAIYAGSNTLSVQFNWSNTATLHFTTTSTSAAWYGPLSMTVTKDAELNMRVRGKVTKTTPGGSAGTGTLLAVTAYEKELSLTAHLP